MKLFITVVLVLGFGLKGVQAQTLEEFRKAQQEEMRKMLKQQKKGVNDLSESYEFYRIQENKAFVSYLKKEWKAYKSFQARKVEDEDKPVTVPIAKPKRKKRVLAIKRDKVNRIVVPIKTIQPKVKRDDSKILIIPDKNKGGIDKDFGNNLAFQFYGTPISLDVPSQWHYSVEQKELNAQTISDAFDYWSQINDVAFVERMKEYRHNLNLNDWGFYMLLSTCAEHFYPKNETSRVLWTWYMMVYSGFDARIGYSKEQVTLLLPTDMEVYRRSYLRIGEQRYYVMASKGGEWFTYDKPNNAAKNVVRLEFDRPLDFPESLATRDVAFKYNKKPYNFTVSYNKNLIDFYNDYPVVAVSQHFVAPVSDQMVTSLDKNIKKEVDRFTTAKEKTAFLLQFVQNAFPYKRDVEQFGKEKYFYVEEMFAYPFSDCEDRSVLLSFLVDHYVGLDRVGVWSPGHMFVAVDLDPSIGDGVYYHQKRYTVCDPTYEGAGVGRGMPDAMKSKITLIPCP